MVLPRAARPDARRAGRAGHAWPRSRPAGRAVRRRRTRAGGRSPPTRCATRPTGRAAPASSRSAASPSRPSGAAAPHWRRFAPASLHVPEVALARRGDDVRLTLAALARPDDTPRSCSRASSAGCGELRDAPLPLLDPEPAGRVAGGQRDAARALRGRGRPRRASGSAPARWRRSCWPARSRSTRPRRTTSAAVFGVLREAFPSCYVALRRARRRRVRGRQPRAARPPRGSARGHARARGLHAAQRRPRRRRPPRRAAAALRQGSRGARDRRPPHRARAAAATACG